MTWDQDDPDRTRVTRKNFSKDELEDMDFKAYIATSSSEEGEEEVGSKRDEYRRLLLSNADSGAGVGKNDEGGGEEAEEVDMEITFTPGLSEKAEGMLLQREKNKEEETTLDKYLRKQKEKKQQKKLKKSEQRTNSSDAEDVEQEDITEEEEEEEEKVHSEESEEEEGKHFDMKKIWKEASRKGKKTNKKRQRKAEVVDDDFNLNVDDPRFAAALTSHHFAIDPTHPQYKATPAMKALLKKSRTSNSR